MMDENSIHSKADEHINVEMSFDSRDSVVRTGSYKASRSLGGEDGKEDNVATPEVHQRGGDVNPFTTLATVIAI
jgi:hypothetical protein